MNWSHINRLRGSPTKAHPSLLGPAVFIVVIYRVLCWESRYKRDGVRNSTEMVKSVEVIWEYLSQKEVGSGNRRAIFKHIKGHCSGCYLKQECSVLQQKEPALGTLWFCVFSTLMTNRSPRTWLPDGVSKASLCTSLSGVSGKDGKKNLFPD